MREPDEDDWKKLKRLISYLNGTKNMVLKLSADNTGILKWYVDAAYAIHDNKRSHSGGALVMGGGVPVGVSRKQKLNTKSSTEAEIVAVDDLIDQILWTNYFLGEQGYDVKITIIYQDNQSAMLLERKGRNHASRKTKHMNVRYFFVTDRENKGELQINYCPTESMIADYFTKPLQGKKFKDMRKIIMNL